MDALSVISDDVTQTLSQFVDDMFTQRGPYKSLTYEELRDFLQTEPSSSSTSTLSSLGGQDAQR